MKYWASVTVAMIALSSLIFAEEKPATITGWRGDGTGCYPDANPPVTWSRYPKSPVHNLRFQATKPQADDTGEQAKPLVYGFVREWLVLGPASTTGTVSVLDETKAEPREGEKAGELAWQPYELKLPPKMGVDGFGAIQDWIDFKKIFGAQTNQSAWAHTYLYAQTSGKATLLINHSGGLQAWINGELKYDKPKYAWSWNSNASLTYDFQAMRSPGGAAQFDVDLKKGWNRLLLRVQPGTSYGWGFVFRMTVAEGTEYASTNIAWVTKLPAQSLSTPVIVGDKIFVTAEPDELICLNRLTGKILWRRATTYWHAVPETERNQNPLFKEMEPMLPKLETTTSFWDERMPLQKPLQELLWKVDKKKFPWSTHYHLHTIGFTTPTPVTDGQYIYAYFSHGVVTCFDLEGNRKWTQLVTDMDGEDVGGNNVPSPALTEDKLILFRGSFRALDKRSGKVVWDSGVMTQEKQGGGSLGREIIQRNCNESVVITQIGKTKVAICFQGRMVRVSDGKVLQRKRMEGINTPSTPIVISDNIFFTDSMIRKFSMGLTTNDEVQLLPQGEVSVHPIRGMDGTAFSSVLFHDGLLYVLATIGRLYVVDAATMKVCYQQQLEMHPIFDYDACGVTASVALAGKHIYLIGDQGEGVVIEPGREFKLVAQNQIETLLRRKFIFQPQETITRSTPVFAGKYMYLRGEVNLYCIGPDSK